MKNKIVCPRCQNNTLERCGAFWVCNDIHACGLEFSTSELIEEWGYDAADFYYAPDELQQTLSNTARDIIQVFEGEPVWTSTKERDEAWEVAYALMDEMFKDGYTDPESLENPLNDLPYPIGSVGV